MGGTEGGKDGVQRGGRKLEWGSCQLVPLCRFHYGADAVLRDPEQSEIITQLLKGTVSFEEHYKLFSFLRTIPHAYRLYINLPYEHPPPPPSHTLTLTHTHHRPLLIPARVQLHWSMAEHVGPFGSGAVWHLDTSRTHLHQTKHQKYVNHSYILLTTHCLQCIL